MRHLAGVLPNLAGQLSKEKFRTQRDVVICGAFREAVGLDWTTLWPAGCPAPRREHWGADCVALPVRLWQGGHG